MPEPTLTLTQAAVQQKLGVFLGYGRGTAGGDTAWTGLQSFQINDSIESGQRSFYWPEPLEGEATSYDWSFMKPVGNFTFVTGAKNIPLPDDFGGPEGKTTIVTSTSTSMPFRIEWRGLPAIFEMYSADPNMTGPPMYIAVEWLKGTGATQGQRGRLWVFPATDQTYTLQFAYYVNADAITPANPYPYGGTPHAETFLESCLAVAEQRYDDASGVHVALFERRLAASIAMDKRLKPQKLGYNGDRSDLVGEFDRGNVHYWAPAATYNGGTFN